MTFVILIIGILGAISVSFLPRSDELTLRTQAERFAEDFRRLQGIAMAQRKSLCLQLNLGGYQVTEATTPPVACSGVFIRDPVTGSDFVVGLNTAVVTGPAVLMVNSLGVPSGAAGYNVTTKDGSRTITIAIAAVTGSIDVIE